MLIIPVFLYDPKGAVVGLPQAARPHRDAHTGPGEEGRHQERAGRRRDGVRANFADQVHGGHRAGLHHQLQPQGQVGRREDRAHLPRTLRARLRPAKKPLLSQELPLGGRLDRPHLVRGDQGRLDHVDQVPHVLSHGRAVVSGQARRLLHNQNGWYVIRQSA